MTPTADDPMIGHRLSHYLILEKLGEGAMGTVYLAEDMRLGRKVALKRFPREMAEDRDRLHRFKREAKLVASLNHPNIVTLFAVEEGPDHSFFTMERVEGETLDSLLPETGFGLQQFFDISIPLVDALAAAHARGITHRDLKPANVMVTPEGRVKVLDFGIAKLQRDDGAGSTAATELTQEGMFIGTVAYMAPEQVKGEPPDHQSDIFALGIILYQLATGKRPFAAGSSAELVSAILRDEPPSVAEVRIELPNQLGDIIRHCLQKEPKDRYPEAADLHRDLLALKRQFDTGQLRAASATSPPKPAAAAAEPRRGGVGRWVGAAALVAAVIAISVWLAWPRSKVGPTEAAVPTIAEPALRPDVIAVLPLRTVGESGDPVFSQGLAHDLTSLLTALPGLQVVSQARLEDEGAAQLPPGEAGHELGAAHVLEGTLRWDDTEDDRPHRVRVNLQLIRASDGIQTWSEVFDRRLSDPLAIQGEIARAAARGVGRELLGSIPDELLARWQQEELREAERQAEVAARAPAQPVAPPQRARPQASPPAGAPPETRPQQPVPTMGRVRIEFESEKPSGVITLFADDDKALEREFRGRKRGLIGRTKRAFRPKAAQPSAFVEELEMSATVTELRIFIVTKEGATPVQAVPVDFSRRQVYRLTITIDADGVVNLQLASP